MLNTYECLRCLLLWQEWDYILERCPHCGYEGGQLVSCTKSGCPQCANYEQQCPVCVGRRKYRYDFQQG